MRPFHLLVVAAGMVVMISGRVPLAACQAPPRLVIHPLPDPRWRADLADVEKVLSSAAGELWRFFPNRSLQPILVEPQGGPVVLFRRGPQGEYRVRLNTGETYWAQYAFQFAHEFCHILCNYQDGESQHKWFEETLCEVASLFVLRRMADSWQSKPPYPHWRDYAPSLRRYAASRLAECHLPAGVSLAHYYAQHAQRLRAEPLLREKTRAMAAALLPRFEAQPEHWEAIGWLNSAPAQSQQSFAQYLVRWRERAAPRHRPFIDQLARQLGIPLPTSADR